MGAHMKLHPDDIKEIAKQVIDGLLLADERKLGLTEIKPKKANKKKFPPTVDDVKGYCLERSNNVDPESFVDFYESKGWMIGKTKMKSWKAAVRTWEKRNETNQRDNRSKAKRVSDAIKEFAAEGDFAEQLG